MQPLCRVIRHVPTNLPSRFIQRRTAFPPLRAVTTRSISTPHSPHRPTILPRGNAQPQQSAFDPVTTLVILTLGLGATYLAKDYLLTPTSTPHPAPLEEDPKPAITLQAHDPSDPHYLAMPATVPPGRPSTLTPEQETKLKEFWLACLDVFGVSSSSTNHDQDNGSASGASTPAPSEKGVDKEKKKKRFGLLGKKKDKDSSDAVDAAAAGDEDDKYGQTKEFKAALANLTPEELRNAFWSMVKADDPDALLLRFLRARKWDVQNALVMLVSTMHWRAVEMHVDDDIMVTGDVEAAKKAAQGSGAEKKEAEDFLAQLRMGKSYLHGVDKDGRPMCFVRVRLHRQGEQSERSLERYTVYTIETARMLLRENVDTATIVFDMTSFSMANMDYTPVKFMIKCFEANYPESLGSVLVYKSPWIFQGIWKIIKGWLDPVVASKVHFCSNVDELAAFVPRDRIPKDAGGSEDWEFGYTEPGAGEEAKMLTAEGKGAKERIEGLRRGIVDEYEKGTLEWAHGKGGGADARRSLAARLAENYWQLDPYVRARSLYDRTGVIGAGGRLDFYPKKENARPAVNDDVD